MPSLVKPQLSPRDTMTPRRPLLETTLLARCPTGVSYDDDYALSAPLNVLIAYEDGSSVRRALRVACQLATQAGGPIELITKFCRFTLLDDCECRAEATRDAGDADIIIVTTRDATELAAPVSSWLEECLAHRDETQIALLALFGSTDAWSLALRDESSFRSVRQFQAQPLELMDHLEHDPMLAACA